MVVLVVVVLGCGSGGGAGTGGVGGVADGVGVRGARLRLSATSLGPDGGQISPERQHFPPWSIVP